MLKRTPKQRRPKKDRGAVTPDGFKIVAPPKSARRRELLAGEDITTGGGCRTVHRQPAR